MYDAYGHVDYHSYLAKGRAGAEYIAGLATQYLDTSGGLSVCEWGCGPGRILRHLPELLPGARIAGSDYNPRTIAWCSANIPSVTFRLNDLAPPLPFADDAFDFLYAISVFTHLSEPMHSAWIEECKRVVRPGGLILLTVHGDRSATGLSSEERARYDAGQVVVRGGVLEGSRIYIAYQSWPFMRDVLLRGLEVILRSPPDIPRFAVAQDLYLARKPEVV
jgi:SAM-dependent methyltransferase